MPNNHQHIEAFIFDMDGLLVDSEPFWRQAEVKLFNELGASLTEKMCFETKGIRLDEVVSYWHERFPWDVKIKSLKQLEHDIIDEMVHLITTKGHPMAGVIQTLEAVKSTGKKVALASSSSSRLINAVLDSLDIRAYFEVIQSAEKEEFGKPHPGVFITTARKLGVAPDKCVVFEDSLMGVVAGLAAKMKVIAIPEPQDLENKRFHVADITLNSLELFNLSLIEQL
jgi:sugar-phosphatase